MEAVSDMPPSKPKGSARQTLKIRWERKMFELIAAYTAWVELKARQHTSAEWSAAWERLRVARVKWGRA